MRPYRKKPWKRGFFLFRFRNPVEARSDRHAECDFFVKCEKALAFTGLRGYIKAGKRKTIVQDAFRRAAGAGETSLNPAIGDLPERKKT